MNVLITGAQGLVGRYLAAAWLTTDPTVQITGIGRSPGNSTHFSHRVHWNGQAIPAPMPPSLVRALDSPRYCYLVLDLCYGTRLKTLLASLRIDCIVHLAAALRDEPIARLLDGNLLATHSLLEAIITIPHPRPKLVLGSSGSVYGAVSALNLPVQESLAAQPVDLYAVTKRASEDMATIYARANGFRLAVARIFNVVAAGQEERHLCGVLARQFAERATGLVRDQIKVGPLNTTRDFIDARDVAQGLMLLAQQPFVEGFYNLGTGVESPVKQVFDQLAALSGFHMSGTFALPTRLSDMPRQYADMQRLHALGFTPRFNLEESLQDVYRYYIEQVANLNVRGDPA